MRYLVVLVLLHLSTAQQPADKNANEKTKATYEFLTGLPKQGKFLSGQFVGWSKVNFDWSQIIAIQNVTGHIPAVVGCDYLPGWAYASPPQLLVDYSCNMFLKDHSDKHGLVTVSNHFPNPASPNGGNLRNKSSLVFSDILNPDTETGQRWRAYLDVIAQGLNDLQQSNVTVLYRPLHEMNGGWFWWGLQDPTEYKNVWASLFDYFCNQKHLHNLLWVYAPNKGPYNLTAYYPGDAYVDIVAMDVYVDNPVRFQTFSSLTIVRLICRMKLKDTIR